MNSAFRRLIAVNEVGSVDIILKRFRPTAGLNEGDREAVVRQLNLLLKCLYMEKLMIL
jgi:hypothetical protein